jgi:hypothetical protein
MPTNRTRRTRGQTEPIPQWLTRFLNTGEIPGDCTPDAAAFCDWQLLAGFHRAEGRSWPDPNTVRQPDRIPRAYGRCGKAPPVPNR